MAVLPPIINFFSKYTKFPFKILAYIFTAGVIKFHYNLSHKCLTLLPIKRRRYGKKAVQDEKLLVRVS